MELYDILPRKLKEENVRLEEIEEIRLRVGQPLELVYADKKVKKIFVVDKSQIYELLNYASGYSLYAYEDELKRGFLTAKGGHRIGVVGKVTSSGMDDISGLNIRVAKEQKGCSKDVIPYIRKCEKTHNSIYNTLIISSPGDGKTTLLRDCIRELSYGSKEHPGIKVGVVDERSEIGATFNGMVQNDLGPRTDVLDQCSKKKGMEFLLRSMSPEVIAVDEIAINDCESLKEIFHCGIRVLGTIHAGSIKEVMEKEWDKRKIAFERYILIVRDLEGRRNISVYNHEFEMLRGDCHASFECNVHGQVV